MTPYAIHIDLFMGNSDSQLTPEKDEESNQAPATEGITRKLLMSNSSPAKGTLSPYPAWLEKQDFQCMDSRTSFTQRKRIIYSVTL